jgi:hypothetical protein
MNDVLKPEDVEAVASHPLNGRFSHPHLFFAALAVLMRPFCLAGKNFISLQRTISGVPFNIAITNLYNMVHIVVTEVCSLMPPFLKM